MASSLLKAWLNRSVSDTSRRPTLFRVSALTLRPTFRGRPVNEYPRWQRITVAAVFVVFAGVYLYVVFARANVDFFASYAVVYALFIIGAGVVRRHRRRRAAEAVTANR